MGDRGESLAKAKGRDIHCFLHPCRAGHLFHQQGRQAGRTHFTLGEPMLAIHSHSRVLHEVDIESLRTCFIIFPGTELSLTIWSSPDSPFCLAFFFPWRQISHRASIGRSNADLAEADGCTKQPSSMIKAASEDLCAGWELLQKPPRSAPQWASCSLGNAAQMLPVGDNTGQPQLMTATKIAELLQFDQ